MNIHMLPGDGIGPEIASATVDVLAAVDEVLTLGLSISHGVVGHESLRIHGVTLTDQELTRAGRADGIVLGPTATMEFDTNVLGQINPSMAFRKHFDLYANLRPARTFEGLPNVVGNFDIMIVRENIEGFYPDRNMEKGRAELLVTEDVAVSIRRITRQCCRRIAERAFALAVKRRGRVTAVHKANVMRISDGIFLEEVSRVAQSYPQVVFDDVLVDAMVALVVRNPRRFDVVVTTNMFGDILSDLTAELTGSLGLGGSLNVGDAHGMAQASHGSAPDIAGRNIANPCSLILSAAQLLAWHGERRGLPLYVEASRMINESVASALAAGNVTPDLGGTLGTDAMARVLVDGITHGLRDRREA